MKLAILGDLSVTDTNRQYFANQFTNILFGDVPSVWKDCDRVIVNLETAVTNKDTTIKKFGPCIKAPFGTIECLKKIGVTDLMLSNNHIFDYGTAGLIDTIKEIKKNNLNFTGIGKNYQDSRKDLIIKNEKNRIAIVNVCEHEYSYAIENRCGARPYDPYDTLDDVENAKKNNDYVIVIYHGGKEHCQYPSPRLYKLCRSLVKHGADVVLCQHSHCIGCYERFHDGHILYGQGNFHFVYSKEISAKKGHKYIWHEGLVTLLTIDNGVKIEFVPYNTNDFGIELAKGSKKDQILSEFNQRNEILANGDFIAKWEEFCHQPSYYGGIIKEGKEDFFAHLLDCEAHSDVLRVLHKTWNETNR